MSPGDLADMRCRLHWRHELCSPVRIQFSRGCCYALLEETTRKVKTQLDLRFFRRLEPRLKPRNSLDLRTVQVL